MEAKHSPLPWARNKYQEIVDANGKRVAVENFALGGMSNKTIEHNDNLIIRAVNSHQMLVDALTECLQNTGGGWIAASVIDRARAALAAAEAA